MTMAHEHQYVGNGNGDDGTGDDGTGDDGDGDSGNDGQLVPFTLEGLALEMPTGARPALLPQFLAPAPPTGAAAASAAADVAAKAAKAAVRPRNM